MTGAYALGPISGGHFNPAVTIGLWAGGRFPARGHPRVTSWRRSLGAIAAAGVLYLIASGKAGFDLAGGFASNGYGEHSPGGYSLTAALVSEIVMTFMFLIVILGATHRRAPVGFAGLAIGLALTLIHLISIPGHQHLGEPGAEHGTGALRRRLGAVAALALLGRADRGRGPRRAGSTGRSSKRFPSRMSRDAGRREQDDEMESLASAPY